MQLAVIGKAFVQATEQLPTVRFSNSITWITLALLISVALALCLMMLRPWAGPLFGGAVLAVCSYPLHQGVRRRVGNRTISAALSVTITCLVLLMPLTVIAVTVSKEVERGYASLETTTFNAIVSQLWMAMRPGLESISAWLGLPEGELQRTVMARVQETAAFLFRQAVSVSTSVGGGILKLAITVVALFFFLRDGKRILDQGIALSPLGRQNTEAVLGAARDAIFGSLYGVGGVALAQGVVCGVGAWIAGLPSPALWGLAASVVSVLPVLGSALVWIPGSLVLFAQGSPARAIFLLAWGLGIVGTIDNLIRPLVLSTHLSLHPLLLFGAVMGGITAFGPIGIVLGPLILGVTAALLRVAREIGLEARKDLLVNKLQL